MAKDRHVLIGKISKAHGIKGEVKVAAFSGDPDEFRQYNHIFIVAAQGRNNIESGREESFTILQSRSQGRIAILQLDGVNDRGMAESLAGSEVWVDHKQLADLQEDEFYWHDFVGRTVVVENGRNLGRVENLFATGAHDIMVIKGGGREYLIPATKEFISRVDADTGDIVVTPPPGLLEINE